MIRLCGCIKPESAVLLSGDAGRDQVLRELAGIAAEVIPGAEPDHLYDALLQREQQMPTSTPEGIAFPHAILPEIKETLVIAARVDPGVVMSERDHPPADLLFCIFGSSERPWDHVRLLARLSRVVRGDGAMARLRRAQDGAAFFATLMAEDELYG